jgi:glycosyltransferase involved in cell wall biosynthesis
VSQSTANVFLDPGYVLVTAAYNEELYIERAIRSVIVQSRPPKAWVIVSDGSTDRTDEIVREYAACHSFIRLHRITKPHARNFGAQVDAINTGVALLNGEEYGYIGNLDADITLEPTYFERLLQKFEGDADLGLAGGWICEDRRGHFPPRKHNSVRSVPHAIQLFRRNCFESLGGYVPFPYGGPDWHAEVLTRMKGWRVRAFPELPVFHHRPTGTGAGLLRYWYREGFADYSLGSHPMVEVLRCIRRLKAKPLIIGALLRLSGFVSAYWVVRVRPVSPEFVNYLRSEQKQQLNSLIGRGGPQCIEPIYSRERYLR